MRRLKVAKCEGGSTDGERRAIRLRAARLRRDEKVTSGRLLVAGGLCGKEARKDTKKYERHGGGLPKRCQREMLWVSTRSDCVYFTTKSDLSSSVSLKI